jgi:hypothetical protein
LFVQTTVVPALIVTISGSKELWIISTFFTIPFEAGAAGWAAAGWVAGAAGFDEDDDGAVHPEMIAIQIIRVIRRMENFLIKNRVGPGVVILFLLRTEYQPVHGNRS